MSMPKLRTYILHKNRYETETYVKMFMSRKQRSLLAQTRAGILPLKVETGRFRNIKDPLTGNMRRMKIEERTCDICKQNFVS